jgi:cardiolipin synthase
MSQELKSLKTSIPTLLPQYNHLNQMLTRVGHAPLLLENKVELLLNAPETYKSWFKEIEKAKKWIHLENYIFHADLIGHKFAEALIKKAKEGVRVRVIYDWFGSQSTPKSFWKEMRAAGIEVSPVNPPSLLSPLNFVKRDHRKFLGIDGIYGSLGGVCIGDEWLETAQSTGLPYRDTAVSILGPGVAELEKAFAKMWLVATKQELPDVEKSSGDNFPEGEGEKAVRIISQKPGKMHILNVLEMMISGAEKRLWIADAYFIAIPSLYQALVDAARAGVDVRILLPATNDLLLIGIFSRTGYRSLLEAGVKIYEYRGPMMHSKTTVIDGWWSRVGSTNLNISSLLLNWELDLIVEDKVFGVEMEKMFENDLKNAREIHLGKDARRLQMEKNQPLTKKERRFQKRFYGSGSKVIAAATSIGRSAFLNTKSSDKALYWHEVKVNFIVSLLIVIIAVLIFLFPKFLAWPVAIIAVLVSIFRIARFVKPAK